MITATITLRPNGSMTLPKKVRNKFNTIHYMVVEVPEGVLLKPIEEIQYYEERDGSFGVRFPYGIRAGKLAAMMRTAIAELEQEKPRKKHPRSKNSARG